MAKYIARQEEHHHKHSFSEEVRMLVERYGLKWKEEPETVQNGFSNSSASPPR